MLSGMTATSIGPDSNQVMQALGKLKWLCVMDPLPTTSSEFWRAPGIDPAKVQTEVFMLPATHWIEKDGSFTNSGRWAQWKEQVLPPEGESRHDHWILAELFQRVETLYRQQGGKFPDPVMAMTLDVQGSGEARARRDRAGDQRQGSRDRQADGDLRACSKADGTTTAGDWIYTGSYPRTATSTKRRNGVQDPAKNDPTGMGYYPKWAWSWPLNRRVLYNRASADPQGKPWDPKRPGIRWDGTGVGRRRAGLPAPTMDPAIPPRRCRSS